MEPEPKLDGYDFETVDWYEALETMAGTNIETFQVVSS